MMMQLEDALIAYREDESARVAIITGSGDRAFCAGADLGRMANPDGRANRRLHLFDGLDIDKPIVGAINGHCLAGGLGVALLCDVRIASDNATFGCMGTARGILPGAGQTKRLPEVVGLGNALWLLMSGERIDAQEALRWGLVNRLVPQSELANEVESWARILASRAPLAVRATKRAAIQGLTLNAADALLLEAELQRPLMATEDSKEGLAAFKEKRQPVFKGR
jgi:enoyl-CoA hydratase/carnithine racemase